LSSKSQKTTVYLHQHVDASEQLSVDRKTTVKLVTGLCDQSLCKLSLEHEHGTSSNASDTQHIIIVIIILELLLCLLQNKYHWQQWITRSSQKRHATINDVDGPMWRAAFQKLTGEEKAVKRKTKTRQSLITLCPHCALLSLPSRPIPSAANATATE